MEEEKEVLASKIAYFELAKVKKLREDVKEALNARAYFFDNGLITLINRYNEIVRSLKETLKMDQEAIGRISGIQEINLQGGDLDSVVVPLHQRILADFGVLQGVLESFIIWHLPVEKQKIIGFRKDDEAE